MVAANRRARSDRSVAVTALACPASSRAWTPQPVPMSNADAELRRLADLLNLGEFLDQPCATLSTGQKQRVNLARALIHRPPVMLLDEPTLGLDVVGSQVINEFIAHVKGEGKAVVLCTHHLDDAQRLCTRFGLMQRGRLVSEGTLTDLREQTGCDTLVDMFLKLCPTGALLATG